MSEIPFLHDSLLSFLEEESGLRSVFADRIYHEWPPQSAREYPQLVFQEVAAGEIAEDMEPPDSTNEDHIEQSNYQFDILGKESGDTIEAAKMFNTVMRKFRGTMGAVEIQHIAFGNRNQIGEIAGSKQRRRVSFDLVFFYNLSEE